MTYGTEPYKLHRTESPGTSVDAAYEVDTTALEQMVHEEIKRYPDGCIADDLLNRFHGYPYSSITARFSALIREKLIERTGERRKGRSGRGQSVMVNKA